MFQQNLFLNIKKKIFFCIFISKLSHIHIQTKIYQTLAKTIGKALVMDFWYNSILNNIYVNFDYASLKNNDPKMF